jgi:DNA polymerase-3 subunit gamma/tau
MKGDVAAALAELRDQYDIGADPSVVLADLAEFTHFVTRVKVVPAVADDISLAEAERTRGRAFAAALSMRVLSRTWQMLLNGIAEVQAAGRPIAAAEMVLVRIAYVADLPTPDEAIRSLDGGDGAARPSSNGGAGTMPGAPQAQAQRFESPRGGGGPRAMAQARPAGDPVAQPAERPQAEPVLAIATFGDLVALAASKRDLQMKAALERDIRPVRCEDGRLEIALEPGAAKTLVNDLSRKLQQWTGKRWMVIVSAEQGAATLRSQAEAKQAELETGVRGDPLVQAVLGRFPGAEIVGVRGPGGEPPLPPVSADDDAPPLEDDGLGDNWIKDDEG